MAYQLINCWILDSQKIGRPVLLFHGLMDNSITWIINMPHESLAYILADQGYEVSKIYQVF